MLDNKSVFAIGSKGVLIPLFALNRSCGCTRFEYGMKCDNAYALEAWYEITFTIVFAIDISMIYTESGTNTTCFCEIV